MTLCLQDFVYIRTNRRPHFFHITVQGLRQTHIDQKEKSTGKNDGIVARLYCMVAEWIETYHQNNGNKHLNKYAQMINIFFVHVKNTEKDRDINEIQEENQPIIDWTGYFVQDTIHHIKYFIDRRQKLH